MSRPSSPKPHEDETDPRPSTPPPADESVEVESLMSELKASLASSQTLLATQATRLSTLSDLETELAQLKDQHAFLAAAKEAVEKQLHEETKKREIAEESVEMLRGQVEQARRGVGMLQKQEKERKRLSYLPPATTGLGINTDPEEVLAEKDSKESKASKRASMLIGRGHRRTSSHSEHSENLQVVSSSTGATSPILGAPRAGGLRELRLGSGNGPAASSTVITSPTFEDNPVLPVPPAMNKRSSSNSIHSQNFASTSATPHLESAYSSPQKSEENRLKAELAEVRARLAESEESREASEACLKALREFMAAGGTEGGAAEQDLLKTMRLPPLPTDKDAEDPMPQDQGGKKGGWGFKLWKQGPMSPALSTAVEPPATPAERISPPGSVRSSLTPKVSSPLPTPGELPTENTVNAVPTSSTPLGNFVSGWTKSVVPGTPAEGTAKPAAARSLSSFFSRKKEDTPKDKDLPPAPQEEDEAEMQKVHADQLEAEKLEPSPQIVDGGVLGLKEDLLAPAQPNEGEGEGEGKHEDEGEEIPEVPVKEAESSAEIVMTEGQADATEARNEAP